jgi:hypothetical protein
VLREMLSTDDRNAPGRASGLTSAACTSTTKAAHSKVLICRFSKCQLGGLTGCEVAKFKALASLHGTLGAIRKGHSSLETVGAAVISYQ